MAISIQTFLDQLDSAASTLVFNEVIALIDANYHFKETAFSNGTVSNKAGENSGSCKVFSFALTHNLTQAQTLNLFAEHYRDAVAPNPDGDDHQNIRQFMRGGFAELNIVENALSLKA